MLKLVGVILFLIGLGAQCYPSLYPSGVTGSGDSSVPGIVLACVGGTLLGLGMGLKRGRVLRAASPPKASAKGMPDAATRKCPRCGAAATRAFCTHCGAKISQP